MRLKGLVAEDFVNYKLPSIFLSTCFCDFKCCKEAEVDIGVCQNAPLSAEPIKDISDEYIYRLYVDNPITKAVVIGGMEPIAQLGEVLALLRYFREHGTSDPFVIYTGYYPDEIQKAIESLKQCPNIIIKFGRYIPNRDKRYDEVLGVELASDNQYAEAIS